MARSFSKLLVPAAALIGALTGVSPAFATDTSFATYTGTSASFKTVQTGTSVKLSETSTVVFSFLNTNLAPKVTGVSATLTFTATALDTSYTAGKFPDQADLSGTYTFTSTTAYTIGSTTYAAGSNLLTVSFSGADLYGKNGGKTATFSDDSTLGGTVTYSSDFLDFSSTNSRDFAIALSAIAPKFGGTTSLNSFTGTPVGVFSSDPAPVSTAAVPEPATWMLMLAGFGAIGLGVRRSERRGLRNA